MLLPFVADVNATVYYSYNFLVVDGFSLCFVVLMFDILFQGRWYCLVICIGRCYNQSMVDLSYV